MMKLSGAVIALLLIADGASAATCTVPTIRTLNNQTVDGYMTVSSGKRCSIRLRRSSGPTDKANIVARPSHGGIHVDGGNRIVYRSRPGYTGSDSFAYARRGFDSRNSAVVRTVRVNVTVTP